MSKVKFYGAILALFFALMGVATIYSCITSRNDLPLALASGDCVAVNPDPVLLEAARENGWLVNAWKL